ncbi:MAG: ECF transporter S component [Deltaproteobacteria bacterium]|uniref:ECF transporter S component n=1 Tax=Candidatus Zymogenus saltonus TaxID=2844893 RepID=A0A9D8PNK8_9DELT|nr:ECF transporter S component [Candidatus Zymogenus saltonus]
MSSEGKMRADFRSARTLALLALLSALVTVATLVVRIPIVATKGYFNLGDALIFIAAALFGPLFGMIVGGVGSALADMIGGYIHFAPWTFFIKGIEGLMAGFLLGFFKVKPWSVKGIIVSAFSFALAAAWMVAGYFGAEYIIYGLDYAPPLAELPFNVAQGGISAAVAVVLVPIVALALPKRTDITYYGRGGG